MATSSLPDEIIGNEDVAGYIDLRERPDSQNRITSAPERNIAASALPTGSNSEWLQPESAETAVPPCESQSPANSCNSWGADQLSDSQATRTNNLSRGDLSGNSSEMSSLTTVSSMVSGAGSAISQSEALSNQQPFSLDDIDIQYREYPQEFRDDHFDVLLIYTADDVELAEGFRYILESCIKLENGEPPKVYLLDSECISHKSSRFASLGEAIERSTYMFMLVTRQFCEDSWAEIQRDECLMESINNPMKRWCVIPIITQPRHVNLQLPFGLRALKGINIARIFSSRRSDLELRMCGGSYPPRLTIDDIDAHFLRNITRMLNDRLNMKLCRIEEQNKQLQKWLKAEKGRRWEARVLEQERSRREQQQREEANRNFLERVQRGDHPDLRPAAAPKADLVAPDVRRGSDAKQVHYHYHYESTPQPPNAVYNFNGSVVNSQFGRGNTMDSAAGKSVERHSSDVDFSRQSSVSSYEVCVAPSTPTDDPSVRRQNETNERLASVGSTLSQTSLNDAEVFVETPDVEARQEMNAGGKHAFASAPERKHSTPPAVGVSMMNVATDAVSPSETPSETPVHRRAICSGSSVDSSRSLSGHTFPRSPLVAVVTPTVGRVEEDNLFASLPHQDCGRRSADETALKHVEDDTTAWKHAEFSTDDTNPKSVWTARDETRLPAASTAAYEEENTAVKLPLTSEHDDSTVSGDVLSQYVIVGTDVSPVGPVRFTKKPSTLGTSTSEPSYSNSAREDKLLTSLPTTSARHFSADSYRSTMSQSKSMSNIHSQGTKVEKQNEKCTVS